MRILINNPINCKLCRRCVHFWVKWKRTVLVLLCIMTLDLSPLTHFPQIGADGMNSAVRKAGKFHVFQQDYKQQAVVATLEVSGVSRYTCTYCLIHCLSQTIFWCLWDANSVRIRKKFLNVFDNLVLVKISCCEPVRYCLISLSFHEL